jgi:hypothetical protein
MSKLFALSTRSRNARRASIDTQGASASTIVAQNARSNIHSGMIRRVPPSRLTITLARASFV